MKDLLEENRYDHDEHIYADGVIVSKRQKVTIKNLLKAQDVLLKTLRTENLRWTESIEYARTLRKHDKDVKIFSNRMLNGVVNYYNWLRNLESMVKGHCLKEFTPGSMCARLGFPTGCWKQQKKDPTKFKLQGVQGYIKIPIPKEFNAKDWDYLNLWYPQPMKPYWRVTFRKSRSRKEKEDREMFKEGRLSHEVKCKKWPWRVHKKTKEDIETDELFKNVY